VLFPQLNFITLISPQLMQYHASHVMTGWRRGGTAASAGRGSTTSWMVVELKLVGEGLILLFLRCDSTLHEPTIA
jgi:hypothetical protein